MPRILPLALLVLFAVAPAHAQKAAPQDENLKFVQALRTQGMADLALEYLEKRLKKDPRYAADVPLEIATLRLDLAAEEPDAAKRMAMFEEARKDFEEFLKKNASHPRAADARFQIAQIVVRQAKTQLTQALAMPDTDESRGDAFTKARGLFAEARKELQKLGKSSRADVELGILLVNQARTYYDESPASDDARAKLLKEAIDLLDKASNKLDDRDPQRWVALAWIGRARSTNGEPREATKRFRQVLGSNDPNAAMGRRLAGYFELLGDYELQQGMAGNPKPEDINKLIIKGESWRQLFGRFLNTPEGYGVQYILARAYFLRGQYPVVRDLVRRIEETDNEFTSRAQEIKIDVFVKQNTFTKSLLSLNTFDECYMRGLYEHHQLNKDPDKKFAKEDARKKQQQAVVKALERALTFKDRRPLPPRTDLASAYYLLTGYHLTLGDLKKAADVGEAFVRKDPRARHASLTALFTAQALTRLIREGAADDYEMMPEERQRLYKLGQYMAERWPGEKAGAVGRYLVVDYLLKRPLTAKDPEGKKKERAQREQEALKTAGDFARLEISRRRASDGEFAEVLHLLRNIRPDFENYGMAQYQLGLAALQLDANYNQLKGGNPNDKDLQRLEALLKQLKQPTFQAIAIKALESVPEPDAAAQPETNYMALQAKSKLLGLYYPLKKFDEMEKLSRSILTVLDGDVPLPPKVDKGVFKAAFSKLILYALYGRAQADYTAGRFQAVATRLDPFIADLAANKYGDLKEDAQLLNALLGLCFRSNLQSQRLTQATKVRAAWTAFEKDNPKILSDIVGQTVFALNKQVKELRQNKDKEKLAKTVDGFTAFLDQVAKDPKAPKDSDFRRLLAQGYLSMDKYARAADVLSKIPKPDPKGNPQDREEGLRRVARVLLIRAYREQGKETKDDMALNEAKKTLEEIMGADNKGWGRHDINALIEEIYLYSDLTYYGASANRADALLSILQRKLSEGGPWKDRYFEVCYLYVRGVYQYALSKEGPERDRYVTKAALWLYQLTRKHADLGGDESKARFEELLGNEQGKLLKDGFVKAGGKWPL
jgi:hypothetical protein